MYRFLISRFLVLGAFALLLAGCIDVETPIADGTNADGRRTVSVSGHGELQIKPDQAKLSFSIALRGDKLPALQEQAGQIMTDFLTLTRELNITQVNTTQLQVQPLYHWKEGQQIHDGYEVQRYIEVMLKDLDKLGLLIEQAIDTGVNQISRPDLQSSQAEAMREKALQAAAADARTKALLLAKELNVTLGAVQSITAMDNQPRPYAEARTVTLAAGSSGAAQTYQPGLITFTADVQASFDLAVD